VPTQIVPAATGDSDSVEIVQYGVLGYPILLASFVVRSGLIASQWSPRSRERNSSWAQA
jgi:hypothetical protein